MANGDNHDLKVRDDGMEIIMAGEIPADSRGNAIIQDPELGRPIRQHDVPLPLDHFDPQIFNYNREPIPFAPPPRVSRNRREDPHAVRVSRHCPMQTARKSTGMPQISAFRHRQWPGPSDSEMQTARKSTGMQQILAFRHRIQPGPSEMNQSARIKGEVTSARIMETVNSDTSVRGMMRQQQSSEVPVLTKAQPPRSNGPYILREGRSKTRDFYRE